MQGIYKVLTSQDKENLVVEESLEVVNLGIHFVFLIWIMDIEAMIDVFCYDLVRIRT